MPEHYLCEEVLDKEGTNMINVSMSARDANLQMTEKVFEKAAGKW